MHNDLLFETIKDLRKELELVDQAIRQVEALADGKPRRGRPPKAVAVARDQAESAPVRVRRKPRRRGKPRSSDNDR